jgi:outer membrane protein OmpA-like peptidoglycan-associated protein
MMSNQSIGKFLIIGTICLLFFSSSICAQEVGYIEMYINASNQASHEPIEGATITIYRGDTEIKTAQTSKKGKAKFQLKYGSKYRIVLFKEGYVKAFLLLNGEIPKKKEVMISGFEQVAFFIDKKDKTIDTLRFKHPFTKWDFDLKEDRFKEDAQYLVLFEQGVFKEDEIAAKELADKLAKEKSDKEKAEKEKEEVKRKILEAKQAAQKNKKKIAGKLVTSGASSKPIVLAKIALVNAKGEKIETTITNAVGGFAFTELDPDQNFIVEILDIDPKFTAEGAKISLSDKDGKEIQVVGADTEKKFRFKILSSDKQTISDLSVNDKDLRVDVLGMILRSGKNLDPIRNLRVNFTGADGGIIQTSTTDQQGKFRFKNLPYDDSHSFSIDEIETQLKAGEKLILTDEKGKTIMEFVNDNKKYFRFKFLSSEHSDLETTFADAPWLKVIDQERAGATGGVNNMVIKEKVYFNSADATLLPQAQRTLDEVINVMSNVSEINIELSSHTDSKGSDDYNMALSKRRAKSAVDYIVAHGIAPNRISGIGYGETRLINKCGNGVECSDEEHAQNRRLEFKVTKK